MSPAQASPADAAGRVRSVNAGRPEPDPARRGRPTGIHKHPVDGPVALRDPGPRGGGPGSGVPADFIGDARHHGGRDQAVYAFAREELDHWARELGRELPDGSFGENLTLEGFAVDDARLGDRWRVGTALLHVTDARIPCGTFRAAMQVRGWLRRFTERGCTGAYLRVLEPGTVRAGDRVELVHRAGHRVGVRDAFRAQTTDRGRLPALLAAGPDLRPELRAAAERAVAEQPPGSGRDG